MNGQPQKLGYGDVQVAAKQAALSALTSGQGAAQAARAAIDTAERLLTVAVDQVGLHRKMAEIQCGAGCVSCCHQMVGVTPAELALLRQAIALLPMEEQAATSARIKTIATKAAGLDQAQWWQAKLPCPLLDDQGRCVVHQARPLPCRAMNSASADICRRSFAGEAVQIPIAAAPYKIYGHAQAGLAEALMAVKQAAQPVVLGIALADHPPTAS